MAGLLAARILTQTFAHVLILERDVLPPGSEFRPGVPQGHHAHGMLARGVTIYEQLFPGLLSELQRAGALLRDCGDARALFPHGWAPLSRSGVPLLLASRPLLETTVRHRTALLDGVQILGSTTVSNLLFDADGANVIGVRASRRGPGHWQPTETIHASLVVDASGRSSKLSTWLRRTGHSEPHESVVDARLGYASRLYEVPDHRLGDPAMLGELLHAPDLPRGCFALRIEGDRLLVTLQGAAGQHPPHDQDGFAEFMRSLRSPLGQWVEDLRPISPIYRYARTASRKLSYHRLADWPGGLMVLGDAACAFNPLYGQGMTVAAMEALLLRDALHGMDITAAGCRRFQRRLARMITWPWLLATFGDRGWQEGYRPGLSERCAQRLMDLWLRAIPGNPYMFHRFLRVTHLLKGPSSLAHPRALVRLLHNALHRPPLESLDPPGPPLRSPLSPELKSGVTE